MPRNVSEGNQEAKEHQYKQFKLANIKIKAKLFSNNILRKQLKQTMCDKFKR